MRLSKTKRDHSLGIDMTPMIDIVFLLIIFFMTVSQITRVVDQPMSLPNVNYGAGNPTPTTVTINIDHSGALIVSGKRFSLDRTIKTLQNKLTKSANDPSRIKIEIRCDRRCPSRFVNQLISQLSEIGFTQIRAAVSGDR